MPTTDDTTKYIVSFYSEKSSEEIDEINAQAASMCSEEGVDLPRISLDFLDEESSTPQAYNQSRLWKYIRPQDDHSDPSTHSDLNPNAPTFVPKNR